MSNSDIKKRVEMWREQRAEKLMARLSRQANTSTPSKRLSPSILGIKSVPISAPSVEKQVTEKLQPHKKGPIEVRQTKSSSLRLHLANPLLEVQSLQRSKTQSLMIKSGDDTNDKEKEQEKIHTFAVPKQKSVLSGLDKKTPNSKPLMFYNRGRLNEEFTITNHPSDRKNPNKTVATASKLRDATMKTNQIKSAHNKQTDKPGHVETDKYFSVDCNVSISKEDGVFNGNNKRETFSIGSSYNKTVKMTELQHFEENYCNKVHLNDIETSELLSGHGSIIQTECNSEINATSQNTENSSADHKETDMQSESIKRRETFNIDMVDTKDCNNTEAKDTKNIVCSTTTTVPDISSGKQKKMQNDITSMNKPHVSRKSLCTTNPKNSPSCQNMGMKRNSKSLGIVNKPTKSNMGVGKYDSNQRPTATLTNMSHSRKSEKETKLRRSLTYSHISGIKSLPANRRMSFIINRKHDVSSKKMVSPITEEGSMTEESLLCLSTPKPKQNCTSIAYPSSMTPYHNTLKKNLEKWLAKRNKSVNGYRHLQCFLDNKENFPLRNPLSSNNKVNCTINIQDNVQIPVEEEGHNINAEDKENMERSANEKKLKDSDDVEITQRTRDALTDLQRLILEGYDHNECERWLQALHSRNHRITEFVEYWECVAALEETRGDIKMAVDSYQRAIIRGAEVESVNEHLNRLFDKMILLNINPTPTKPQKQTRTYVDPKNIFSSTVIRFALQQKAVKKIAKELGVNENKIDFLATPVRRTTRVHHRNNTNCVRSLSELEPEIKNNTNFKPNPAFCSR